VIHLDSGSQLRSLLHRPLIKPLLTAASIILACLGPIGLGGVMALSNDDCLMCHANMEPKLDVGIFHESSHGELTCTMCHEGILELPHATPLPTVKCDGCHTEEMKAYRLGVHGKAAEAGSKDTPSCATCHGKHDIFPKEDARSRVNPLNVPKLCAGCHENQSIVRSHSLPDPEFIQQYLGSVHGSGVLAKGLVVSATCSDCHGSHEILPKEDAQSRVNPKNTPTTCMRCHLGIFQDFIQSAHGKAWSAGGGKACRYRPSRERNQGVERRLHTPWMYRKIRSILENIHLPLPCSQVRRYG